MALLLFHSASTFPTQPNHGFGFHRRGTFGGIVFIKKKSIQRKNGRNLASRESIGRQISQIACNAHYDFLHCGFWSGPSLLERVHRDRKEKLGRVHRGGARKVGETNARLGEFSAPFTVLCWTLGIYLLSKTGEVNCLRVPCLCCPNADAHARCNRIGDRLQKLQCRPYLTAER
jgi:hypothetical protein